MNRDLRDQHAVLHDLRQITRLPALTEGDAVATQDATISVRSNTNIHTVVLDDRAFAVQ